jgi:hypothetical protein
MPAMEFAPTLNIAGIASLSDDDEDEDDDDEFGLFSSIAPSVLGKTLP